MAIGLERRPDQAHQHRVARDVHDLAEGRRFLGGAILSSPFVFYFLWSFVAAGLYPHEKHYVHLFLPFSVGLFLLGAVLAFFFVFTPVLKFLLQLQPTISTSISNCGSANG